MSGAVSGTVEPEAAAVTVAANPARGEAAITVDGATLTLRPSFAALTAFEDEVGSLLAFVERVTGGELRLGEIASLFWHCLADKPGGITRERIGDAIVEAGMMAITPLVKLLVRQILKGL